jgi:L-rhamnose isomerase/sugar isomerase
MIDQSHNIEPKLEAMLVSLLNCQTAYAKALIVDRAALAERQAVQDVLGAHQVLREAFDTDVRPLLRRVRRDLGVPEEPLGAYRSHEYPRRVVAERGTSDPGGSGYPER